MKVKRNLYTSGSLLRFSLALLLVLSIGFTSQAQHQANEPTPSKLGITVKPTVFFLGANVGIDYNFAPTLTLSNEFSTHLWIYPNIAYSPSLKWHFKGNTQQGFYIRGLLVGGIFFNETALDDHPYYAGGGLSVGGIVPLGSKKRVSLFGEVGLKYAAPFGTRVGSTKKKNSDGMAYYTFFSPASMPILNFGVRFNL